MGYNDVRTEDSPRSSILSAAWTGDIAILVLRLAVGVVLAYHGWLKLSEVSGFAGFVDSLGRNRSVLGLVTRYVAALFVVEMGFTIALVKVDVGLIAPEGGAGAELDVLILAIALSLALTGAGRWSGDALLVGRSRAT